MGPLSGEITAFPAILGRWSHDAFQLDSFAFVSEPGVLYDDDGSHVRTRPAIVAPLAVCFDSGYERVVHRAPSVDAAAAWHDDLFAQLVAFDQAYADASHAVRLLGRDTARGTDALKIHENAQGRAQDALAEHLRSGLDRRRGHRLVPADEAVFVHLAARVGGCPAGVRVCEDCQLVFSADRANRCEPCRKRGRRRATYPHHEGVTLRNLEPGHLARRVDDRPDYRGRPTVWYSARCAGCDRGFAATDARQRYCEPACKVRHHRRAA